MPRKSGTRNTRILAIDVSRDQQDSAHGELAEIGGQTYGIGRGPVAGPQAPGHEDAADQRQVEQQLEGGRELEDREVPAGVLDTIARHMVSSRCVAGLSTGMRGSPPAPR